MSDSLEFKEKLMVSATPKSSLPLRVWLARHLVVISTLVFIAAYFQEGKEIPHIWGYLGQLGGVIGFSCIVAACITLFSAKRDLRSLTLRATSVLWVTILLLLVGSLAPALSGDSTEGLSKQPESGVTANETKLTIETLKAHVPEFQDMSDLEIARIAHPILAPNTPFEDFARQLGIK